MTSFVPQTVRRHRRDNHTAGVFQTQVFGDVGRPSGLQNALGMLFIGFCACLHPENFTFVDYQLAILTAKDLKTI